MKLLTNVTDYKETIDIARNLLEEYNKSVVFHCYWNGTLNEKHLYSILSCYYFTPFLISNADFQQSFLITVFGILLALKIRVKSIVGISPTMIQLFPPSVARW